MIKVNFQELEKRIESELPLPDDLYNRTLDEYWESLNKILTESGWTVEDYELQLVEKIWPSIRK